jgi:dUTP pyrophosphatase
MRIKIIDFGYKELPNRAHHDDVGADVYSTKKLVIDPHSTEKIPLGFGLELPNGYGGFIFPRSGLSAQGITCELPPIDPGYKGEIHAIVSNVSDNPYQVNVGDRIGQLVITPVVIADFVTEFNNERGTGAFASTGK